MENKINNKLYSRCLITRKIVLPMSVVAKNIKELIENEIINNFEGKCIVEGYLKKNSTKLITFSSGLIERGNLIVFEVIFECDICFPVEGMLIQCKVNNITKAGIHAQSDIEYPSPVDVFLAKDHHYNNNLFAEVQEGNKIIVRVIGQRFELNDKCVTVIGEIVRPRPAGV
jgi:DNA-directed RNA polymerase subunit E'/Rpb7